MKVLWITNIPLPPICNEIGMEISAFGGWMYSSLKRLANNDEIKCGVATIYDGMQLIIKDIDNFRYYLLPLRGKSQLKYNLVDDKN